MLARAPDVVALQEVTTRSMPVLRKHLATGGLINMASSLEDRLPPHEQSLARTYGVAIASRYALSCKAKEFRLPWPEKGLAVIVHTSDGPIEVNTVHVPPGRSHGWFKIDMFEAIHAALGQFVPGHRLLCGDFNSPLAELANGKVICGGMRLSKDGNWHSKRRHRGRAADRWEKGESSVLVGLQTFDLHDVFRGIHGYGVSEFSWLSKHRNTITRRRFDHIFASQSLRPVACEYLHHMREQGLSDHSPIEAVLKASEGLPGDTHNFGENEQRKPAQGTRPI